MSCIGHMGRKVVNERLRESKFKPPQTHNELKPLWVQRNGVRV